MAASRLHRRMTVPPAVTAPTKPELQLNNRVGPTHMHDVTRCVCGWGRGRAADDGSASPRSRSDADGTVVITLSPASSTRSRCVVSSASIGRLPAPGGVHAKHGAGPSVAGSVHPRPPRCHTARTTTSVARRRSDGALCPASSPELPAAIPAHSSGWYCRCGPDCSSATYSMAQGRRPSAHLA